MHEIQVQTQIQRILCASCGVATEPNSANLCLTCIQSQMDISQGIPKQCTIHYCKGCERYLQPPTNWVRCELESRELLSICLKKLKGLDKVRLVDAGFIWTESHSKRIKVKVTIQKEVFKGTILQSIFVVEYIVGSQYCEDCTRVDSNLTWKAVVQVRQKVPHKRTFLWLEQIILKHDAHRDTSNLKEFRDGLDFYYAKIPHAIKMVDFLSSFVPTRMKQSEQLISSDIHSGTSDYKLSYSLEIAPICKDDLVCLPLKLAKSLGNIDQLVVCTRVGTSLIFTSPRTNQKCELRCLNYWEHYFFPLCDRRELVEFYVIDIQHGKPSLVEVSKSTNLSVTWLVNTHLGHILNAGIFFNKVTIA